VLEESRPLFFPVLVRLLLTVRLSLLEAVEELSSSADALLRLRVMAPLAELSIGNILIFKKIIKIE